MSTRSNRQRSVNDRIRIAAQERGIDANRIRRGLVFQRILARLAIRGVVLKGGFCLEVRLPETARATKDMDLVGRMAITDDPLDLQDTLDEALDVDTDDDGFTFDVGRPRHLRDETEDARAWRIPITAYLDREPFEHVKVDLVGQIDEVAGSTE